jgi:hypothetical protein
MPKISYDASVMEQHAWRLYARATLVLVLYTVLGAVVVAAAAAFAVSAGMGASAGIVELMVGAGIGGALGFLIGRERGFQLRLQAQTALCHVQIEKNTRPGDAATASLAS